MPAYEMRTLALQPLVFLHHNRHAARSCSLGPSMSLIVGSLRDHRKLPLTKIFVKKLLKCNAH